MSLDAHQGPSPEDCDLPPRKAAEVTFGLNPPVLDAVRMPRESAEQALGKAMTAARDGRPKGSLRPTPG